MDGQRNSVSITLLTQQQCGLCDDAKGLLGRLTGEYPLSLTALDLGTAEGRALAEQAEVLFPPGVLIDGEAFSYGRVSERKLRRELDRRLASSRKS